MYEDEKIKRKLFYLLGGEGVSELFISGFDWGMLQVLRAVGFFRYWNSGDLNYSPSTEVHDALRGMVNRNDAFFRTQHTY
jgi:hypothetical protein